MALMEQCFLTRWFFTWQPASRYDNWSGHLRRSWVCCTEEIVARMMKNVNNINWTRTYDFLSQRPQASFYIYHHVRLVPRNNCVDHWAAVIRPRNHWLPAATKKVPLLWDSTYDILFAKTILVILTGCGTRIVVFCFMGHSRMTSAMKGLANSWQKKGRLRGFGTDKGRGGSRRHHVQWADSARMCVRVPASVEAYFVSLPIVFTQTSHPNFKILVE